MLNDNCVQNAQVHETYHSVLYNTKVIYRFEEKPQQTDPLIANHRARKILFIFAIFQLKFLISRLCCNIFNAMAIYFLFGFWHEAI